MKIKVSKTILESALIYKAKSDVRYYLNGVCFKTDGRVTSTDGHRLFVGEKHQSVIETDIILDIQKSPTKKYESAVFDTESGIVYYYDAMDIKAGIGLFTVIDGKFPDIDRIIPKGSMPTDKVGFNASYLSDAAKAAKLFRPKFESIIFELNGSTNAAVAKFTSAYGEKGMLIVMPMRIN